MFSIHILPIEGFVRLISYKVGLCLRVGSVGSFDFAKLKVVYECVISVTVLFKLSRFF